MEGWSLGGNRSLICFNFFYCLFWIFVAFSVFLLPFLDFSSPGLGIPSPVLAPVLWRRE